MTTLADVGSARAGLQPHIRRTPVTFDEHLGAWIKWENQQTTGSFKLRGALNKVLRLSPAELQRGLLAASAGNHGQGVALAAQIAGARATVYVSEDAVAVKVEKMLALGAEVVRVPGRYGDVEAAAIRAARAEGKVFVSPYNDPAIMAGAGTLALEMADQCPGAEQWLIPVGGGGLVAGIMAAAPKEVRVIGVQAAASPYLYHEFHDRDMTGVVERPTLADGLAGSLQPGSATIEAIHRAAGMRLVDEEQIARAIAYAYHAHGQVIEGSGAVGLAAVLSRQVGSGGTVVLISGGNIDPETHRRICDARA